MPKKSNKTKERIIHSSWELFQKYGYDNTTLNDILEASKTSRGGFYHHFKGKEDLLFSLAYSFHIDYSDGLEKLDPGMNSVDKLCEFDIFVYKNLEESKFRPFLQQLYGYEVMTDGTRYILAENRPYFQLILSLIKEGRKRGQIIEKSSALSLARRFAAIQRGMTYNWLLEDCRYSLTDEAHGISTIYLDSLRK